MNYGKKSRALECCNIFHWANGKKELISENQTRGPEQTKMNAKKIRHIRTREKKKRKSGNHLRWQFIELMNEREITDVIM